MTTESTPTVGECRPTLDELPDGVVLVSHTGEVLGVNQAFSQMTGRSATLVLHQPLESIIADEDMVRLVGFEAMFRDQAVRDGYVMFTAPDGERRPLIVCSQQSADGLRVVVTTRAPGTVQRELADTSRWAAVEQERAQTLATARDALADKNSALRAAQGELAGAYAALQDELRTRERLEHELRLAQKLEAIGQLAAGVAHEINTPMQYVGDNIEFLGRAFKTMTGYLQRVDGIVGASEEQRTRLAAAQKQARIDYMIRESPKALQAAADGIAHVSNIVRALKSFAHVDSDEMVPCDLNQAIRDSLVVTQSEYKNIAVIETDLGEIPPLLGFVGKLTQVLLNLIVNAAHAIVDAGRAGNGTIRVVSRAKEGLAEITIADNGCGIPETNRDRVFDAFFTTKEVGRGTGQGLSLAHRIVVETHGGTLAFESEPGRGTLFRIQVPIDGCAKRSASAA